MPQLAGRLSGARGTTTHEHAAVEGVHLRQRRTHLQVKQQKGAEREAKVSGPMAAQGKAGMLQRLGPRLLNPP